MSYIGSTKIGKMYLGTTEIGKAYLGNNLVYQQGSGPQPVMIPYVRGGVDSYINTGITADSTTRVIVWARNFNPNSVVLFGSRIATTNGAFGVFAPDSLGTGTIRFDHGTVQTNIGESFTRLSSYHKYELDGKRFLVDDVLIATATASSFSNNLNIYLFAINTNGTATYSVSKIDIAACKIYKNNVLVRDFTAVSSPSVGLYDAVSDTVFASSGSGSLTYGEFDENAYTQLEYVECSGAQYFDSGIRGANTLNYVAKFMAGAAGDWPDLFCAQTTSSSKRYGVEISDTNQGVTFFFNSTSKYYDYGSSLSGKALVAVKSGVTHDIYENNARKTRLTFTDASFSTDYNIFVGCRNGAGTANHFYLGRIYYLGFRNSRNFVPAQVGGIVGMYDTYNDRFYPSATSTPFIAPI